MEKEIALDLKLSRERSGLSGHDLAHLLGCTKQRISKLERGKARVTPDELICLSIIYGQSLNNGFVALTEKFVGTLQTRLSDMPNEPANWKCKRETRQATLGKLAERLEVITEPHYEA